VQSSSACPLFLAMHSSSLLSLSESSDLPGQLSLSENFSSLQDSSCLGAGSADADMTNVGAITTARIAATPTAKKIVVILMTGFGHMYVKNVIGKKTELFSIGN
jgi:hypothetical protein